jgi:predicted anti-sigma-YlaC factor YlaD
MTVTHEEAFALMMDALDGVLKSTDAHRLDDHLIGCSDCSAEWQALQLVDGLLASAPAIPAPAGFSQRVQVRIEIPSWRRTLGMLYALSLGSLLALLLIAVPAAAVLLGIWTLYNEPASFSSLLVWLSQLARVSGSLLDAVWTTVRLFVADLVASPVTFAWTLMAALVVAVWARVLRRPELVQVSNG